MAEPSGWWHSATGPAGCEPLDLNINLNISLQSTDQFLPNQTSALAQSVITSGASTSGSHSPHNHSSSSDTNSRATKPEPAVRKEHTKSRLGCLNCKRRRIKCPQNHPICTHCSRKGLTCAWPEVQFRTSRHSAGGTLPQNDARTLAVVPRSMNTPVPNTTTNTPFSMQDFRLFYHFIQDAHPHHPIGNEGVWTHEVPSIAHNVGHRLLIRCFTA